MPNEVLDAWRRLYPGAYDAVDDKVLAGAIIKKFPGAYDERLKDVLGPRKIESAAPKPTAAGNNLTPAAPGRGPSPPPGATGGIADRAFEGIASGSGKAMDAVSGLAQQGGRAITGAVQDVQVSAIKNLSQIGRDVGHLGADITMPGKGHAYKAVVGLVDSVQRSIDGWAEKYMRTTPPPRQFKIPVLDQTPTEAAGMILSGALLPIPGGGATSGPLLARAGNFLRHAAFGTGAFTALQALPQYFEAKTDEERGRIIASLPRSMVSQFLVSIGMFGAQEFGGVVAAAKNEIAAHAAHEPKGPPPSMGSEAVLKPVEDPAARFIAAVTEQNGQVPEVFKPKTRAERIAEAAEALRAAEAPREAGLKKMEGVLKDRLKKDTGERVEALETDLERTKRFDKSEYRDKKIQLAKDMIADEKAGKGWSRDKWRDEVAKRGIEFGTGPTPPGVLTSKEPGKTVIKARLEEHAKVQKQLDRADRDYQKAVDDKAGKEVTERFKRIRNRLQDKLAAIEKKATGPTPAVTELHVVADDAHADRLIEKGKAEAKIALVPKPGEGGGGKPPKGPEPPKTAYDGGSPNPDTGFMAAMRRWFSPVSVTAADFQQHWTHMWDAIDAGRWNADRNYDKILKDIPDEERRRQALLYMTGLSVDANLPPLDGPTSKYIEYHRQMIEYTMDQLRDAGYISANRFRDILTSMFENKAKAKERFAPISNKDFATMRSGELWTLFADGVRNRKLSPVTRDMATMVNLLENRIATAAAMQRLKLELKAIPGFAIPASSTHGGPPEGYTTSKAGHLDGFYIPKDAAAVLDNLFAESAWDEKQPLVFLGKTQQLLKRAAVSISMFHHQAIFRTMLATGFFDPAGALKGLKMINEGHPIVKELMTRGLQATGARPDISSLIEREAKTANPNAAQKFLEWWDHKLWAEHVPGAIAFAGVRYTEQLTKAHPDWDMDKIYREAVKKTNNAFGLQNLERLGRNKTFQDSLRFLMFAPTWTETRLRMFAGAGKEAVDIVRGRGTLADTMYLRQTIGHALVTGVMAEILNLAMNAGSEDESTRRFGEVSIPFMLDKRGKPLVLDFMGYLRDPVEFVMHPAQVFGNVSKYARGRRSQMVSWAMEEFANEDFKGAPIRRPEASAFDRVAATLGHTAAHTLPIAVQHFGNGIDLLHQEMDDFKSNVGRDLAAFAGFRTRSDYPIELRLKMESQVRNYPAYISQIRTIRENGDKKRADRLQREFNERAEWIEQEIKDSGFQKTLGPWWNKNRRFAYIK